jgi:hypothetical protein
MRGSLKSQKQPSARHQPTQDRLIVFKTVMLVRFVISTIVLLTFPLKRTFLGKQESWSRDSLVVCNFLHSMRFLKDVFVSSESYSFSARSVLGSKDFVLFLYYEKAS